MRRARRAPATSTKGEGDTFMASRWFLRPSVASIVFASIATAPVLAQPATPSHPQQPEQQQPPPTVATYTPEPDNSFSSQWRLWLSGGYARLGSNGDSILDNIDGWYLDAQFARRINSNAPWWI